MGDAKEKQSLADRQAQAKLKRQNNIIEKKKQHQDDSSDEGSYNKPSPPAEDKLLEMMHNLDSLGLEDCKAIAEYISDPA